MAKAETWLERKEKIQEQYPGKRIPGKTTRENIPTKNPGKNVIDQVTQDAQCCSDNATKARNRSRQYRYMTFACPTRAREGVKVILNLLQTLLQYDDSVCYVCTSDANSRVAVWHDMVS